MSNIFLAMFLFYRAFFSTDSAEPDFTPTTRIPNLQVTVQLKLYLRAGVHADYARDLHVETPTGSASVRIVPMAGGNMSRVSVYSTPTREVVLLGPLADYHLIKSDPVEIMPLRAGMRSDSADWTYLGAFDYLGQNAGQGYGFSSAFKECVPVSVEDRRISAVEHRMHALSANCPSLVRQ